jgi:signal transduction histidine kinase/DNA-binding response OmpR family regulator
METRTRQVQIAALSAGRHSLEVIAAADGASWSAAPARLEITILPPWWASVWFRSASIGGLILLGWQFWRFRVRGMVAEQSRLEFAVEARTRELAAEKELTERLLSQSREASHLKTAFLANMSHEIRTPMNGVLGMVSIVLDTDLSAEQREFLTMAKSSAESLLHVLNDILDLSKIEAGKLELSPVEFPIGEMLAGMLRPMALKAFEKGVDLILDVDEDVPDALIGDPGRLQQILVNLVGNAVKFTERGEISVRVIAESPTDAALTTPKRLRFEVRDTGIGIPLEKQQIIFEAFSQADASMARKYGGTGLGLTITSKLVAIMGGQIAIESEIGKGTAITFTAEFELPPEASRPLPQECGMAGIRVLVIEGNKTRSDFLNRLLRAKGMITTAVGSVPEALSALEDGTGELDVILLDAQIGDREAIESITGGNRAGVPIVLLSYLGRFANEDWRRNPAIRRVVSKPVTAADLKAAVRAAAMSRGEETASCKHRAAIPCAEDVRAAPSKRILLVDDNAVNRRVGQVVLEKLGHCVVVVGSGAEGIQALESDRFDVVLMDIEMPQMDGFDATAEIRRRGLDHPRAGEGRSRIIAMTAHAMAGFREKCLAAGMDGYLAKPVRVPELKAALESGF